MRTLAACTAYAVVLLGCAHDTGARTHTELTRDEASLARVCRSEHGAPVGVRYEDTSGGAAVLFTTPGDPTPLREEAQEVARAHNHKRDMLAMQDVSELRLPHTAEVEPIDHGAKLTLLPRRPTDLDGLRRHVQQDVSQLQAHVCAGSTRAL